MKISPHVSIYSFPVSAITSILNRITGTALTGMYIGGGFSKIGGYDIISFYESLSKIQKTSVDLCLLFPSVYHTFGGIRHLMWDTYPKLLTNQKVAKSSYLLLGISFVSTGVLEYMDILSMLRI